MKKELFDFLGTNPSEQEIRDWYNSLSVTERDALEDTYFELLKFVADTMHVLTTAVVPVIQNLSGWWIEVSSQMTELINDFEKEK